MAPTVYLRAPSPGQRDADHVGGFWGRPACSAPGGVKTSCYLCCRDIGGAMDDGGRALRRGNAGLLLLVVRWAAAVQLRARGLSRRAGRGRAPPDDLHGRRERRRE